LAIGDAVSQEIDSNGDQPVMSPDGHMTPDQGSEWRSAWFRATVRRLGLALERVQPARRPYVIGEGVALSTRAGLLVLALAGLVAGCSSGPSAMPTAPTPPPVATPAPTTPAPTANLVTLGELEIMSCINALCTFRAIVKNNGNACAVNISGESWIVSAQGVEVGRARWSMLPATVMRPGDEVYYDGQGMPQIILNHLDGRYFASFVFENRQC
jgi:hypothetical protein